MKKHIYSILLVFLLPLSVSAEPQLLLELNKTEVQIGRHINAQLYGIDLPGKLVDINLEGLRESFGIDILETIEDAEDPRWPTQSVQSIQFKLYPRQIGNYLLPELIFSGIKSNHKNISVLKGVVKSRSGSKSIVREVSLPSAEIWERQQVLIEVKFTTPETFVTLNTEIIKIPGFEVFPVPTKSVKVSQDGSELSAISIGWILFPLVAGQYNLELPSIEYQQSGRTLRTYYLPKQKLNIKALPPYVPPTMPVGKIGISSSLREQELLSPSELSYWDITLTGDGVSPNWMPSVIRQLKSNSNIDFFSTDSIRESKIQKNVLQSQVVHLVPFKALGNGKLELPVIQAQYFDPTTGKIIRISHHPEQAFVLSMTWRFFIGGLLSLLIIFMGRYFYREISALQKRRRLHQAALSQITQATSFFDVRNSLNVLANAEGWPGNLTIQHWTLYWESCFKRDDGFLELLQQLSQACYDKEPLQGLEDFRLKFVSQLSAKKRKRKISLPLFQ